jgi:hypothetical protein
MAQSAVLLAFWYADLEDRCGSWHWIGVAIGVCQTIGMHRNPTGTPGARHLFPHYQSWLWRRLWWACYFRDVWLCLGFGRPMRINLDDCNTPLPTLGDILEDIAGSLEATGGKLLYDDFLSLAKYWLNLLKLTILLGGILANHYRPTSNPTVLDIEKAEVNILANSQEAQNHGRDGNRILTLHWCHLKAYYKCVLFLPSHMFSHLTLSVVLSSLLCTDPIFRNLPPTYQSGNGRHSTLHHYKRSRQPPQAQLLY